MIYIVLFLALYFSLNYINIIIDYIGYKKLETTWSLSSMNILIIIYSIIMSILWTWFYYLIQI